MVNLNDLILFIEKEVMGDELMQRAQKEDYFRNGLQVSGTNEVTKIAVGVTANASFLEQAVEWGAELCLFHHGLDLRTIDNLIPAALQKQLKLVFNHDMSIAYYHYALDAHPEIGNNALIAKVLNAEIGESLYDTWGYVANLKTPKTLKVLKAECEKLFEHDVLMFAEDMETEVTTLGICSGGARPTQASIYEMQQKGIELFISGEGSEDSPHKMLDSGIAYFLGGHYATEVFGVKALGDKIQQQHKDNVEVKFIDVPNPL